jgi:plastocyanin
VTARPALALAAIAAALPWPASAASGSTPDRVMARGSEWQITLSKRKVDPGRVIVQFVNAGEDPHDLRLQRNGGGPELGIGELEPGDYANLDVHLKRGSSYELWCSLPHHRERGMEATLRVARR